MKRVAREKKKKTREVEAARYMTPENPAIQVWEPVVDLETGARSFVAWSSEEDEFVERGFFEEEDEKEKRVIVPPANNKALKNGAVLLPPRVEKKEVDAEELVGKAQDFMHRFFDVPEYYELFSAHYARLSWVYDRLNTVPYLRVMGDTGTGKSRFLETVASLCYKPIFCAGTITPAPLYRMQSFWRGTLVIDEADFRASDEAHEIVKLLNCGFERGKPVLRCDKDNPDDIQVHDAFGPKVISTRRTFKDKALEARCLTHVMTESDREDLPANLPKRFYRWRMDLQALFLADRLRRWSEVDADAVFEMDMSGLEWRLRQGFSSFAVVYANDEASRKRFVAYLRGYQERLVEERAETWEGKVVRFLAGKSREELEALAVRDVADFLREQGEERATAAGVGKVLKSLGLKTAWARVGGRAARFLRVDERVLRRLVAKYVPGGSLDGAWGRQERIGGHSPVASVASVAPVAGEGVEEGGHSPVASVATVAPVAGAGAGSGVPALKRFRRFWGQLVAQGRDRVSVSGFGGAREEWEGFLRSWARAGLVREEAPGVFVLLGPGRALLGGEGRG